MPNTHIVVGTGVDSVVTKPAVLDSLKDVVLAGDILILPWVGGKPAEPLTYVYDYVVNNEVNFLMIHDGGSSVPKVFTESDHGTVQNVEKMGAAFAKYIDGGSAMVLGEDELTETWLLDTFAASNERITFTDIARGMVPVTIGEEETVESEIEVVDISEELPEAEAIEEEWVAVQTTNDLKEEQFVATDSDPTDDSEDKAPEERADIYSFTREEMEHIPERVLKNIAERAWGVGADVPTHVPGIIAKVLDTQQMRKQEAEFVAKASIDEVGTIAATYDLLMTLLRQANEDEGARHLALALTNLEQSALWYYYHDAPGLTGE